MLLGNLAATGGGGDLLYQEVDARGVVLDGESGLEDVSVAVADQGEVFAFGVIKRDAENLAGITGSLEDGADEGVLVAIDGGGLA